MASYNEQSHLSSSPNSPSSMMFTKTILSKPTSSSSLLSVASTNGSTSLPNHHHGQVLTSIGGLLSVSSCLTGSSVCSAPSEASSLSLVSSMDEEVDLRQQLLEDDFTGIDSKNSCQCCQSLFQTRPSSFPEGQQLHPSNVNECPNVNNNRINENNHEHEEYTQEDESHEVEDWWKFEIFHIHQTLKEEDLSTSPAVTNQTPATTVSSSSNSIAYEDYSPILSAPSCLGSSPLISSSPLLNSPRTNFISNSPNTASSLLQVTSNNENEHFLEALYLNRLSNAIQRKQKKLEQALNIHQSNCQESASIGPQIVTFVLSELKLDELVHSKLAGTRTLLVHLAARHNRLDILEFLKSCCCDEKCEKKACQHSETSCCCCSPQSPLPETSDRSCQPSHIQHSSSCLSRRVALWTCIDSNECTPLFYSCQGCSTCNAHDCCVFLLVQLQTLMERTCSSSSSSSSNISHSAQYDSISIHKADRFGNLPIAMAFKKRDWKMCDLLQLFGASLDANHGSFGESLLHTSVRDLDFSRVEYLSRHCPKSILKKNQKDENALFACLKDYRVAQAKSATSLAEYHKQASCSPIRTLVNKSAPKEIRCQFIQQLLENGNELFGREAFEKALVMKNQHGRNFFTEAVAFGDVLAIKTILNYFTLQYLVNVSSRHYERSRENHRKLLDSLIFSKDRQGKNVLHLSLEFAMKRMNKFNREDYQSWLESFCFILTWLEDFTLSFRNCQKSVSLMNPPECDKLFHEKDFQGKSAIEYIEFEISSNLECDKRWLNALDLLKCFECKYVAARTMESIHGITTHANVITTPKHKKGILSALFISSQLSDEHVHPKSMSSSRSSSRSSSSSSSLTLSSTYSSLTAHSVSSSSLSDSLSSSSQSSSKSTSQHKTASMLNPRQQHGNVLKEFMRKLSMKKQ